MICYEDTQCKDMEDMFKETLRIPYDHQLVNSFSPRQTQWIARSAHGLFFLSQTVVYIHRNMCISSVFLSRTRTSFSTRQPETDRFEPICAKTGALHGLRLWRRRSQHVREVKRAQQHVLSQSWEAPEGLPGIWEDVVLEKDPVLQAGGQADVAAHDVDPIVVQCARQVQARLGCVLLQVDPLTRSDVVGLHRQHVLGLTGSPQLPAVF